MWSKPAKTTLSRCPRKWQSPFFSIVPSFSGDEKCSDFSSAGEDRNCSVEESCHLPKLPHCKTQSISLVKKTGRTSSVLQPRKAGAQDPHPYCKLCFPSGKQVSLPRAVCCNVVMASRPSTTPGAAAASYTPKSAGAMMHHP